MTDTKLPEQKRRGRKPKPDKRVPLSVLLDPKLRRLLADSAAEEGRSLTGQTEFVLKQGMTIIYGRNDGPTGLHPVLLESLARVMPKDGDNIIGRPSNIIGHRAAAFLELKFTGRGKDARIARDLGISAGMAKLLRRGCSWTVARLSQAMQLWPDFCVFVFRAPRGDQLGKQLERMAAGLARLANELAALRHDLGGIHQIGVSAE